MKDSQILIATIIVTILGIAGVIFLFSSQGAASNATSVLKVDPQEAIGSAPHSKTAPEATQSAVVATIVVFSDFQCPSCKNTQPLVENVLGKYPGKVRLVYRHFPLDTIHPFARLAAQASEVAAEHGKFWQYHDILFERQQEWSTLGSFEEATQRFAEYAAEIEIDKAKFLERIGSAEVKAAVQEDYVFANSLGVDSTPTFFVNGTPMSAPSELSGVVSTLVANTVESAASPSASLTPEAKE